jgi:hypothetical protein
MAASAGSADAPVSQYSLLPLEGPYEVKIGCALIALIEPREGCDWEYNRWYEDEHMPAAMALPWKFAGRRWVAPRDLQALRYPQHSSLAQPLSAGKYLSVYWLTEGRYQDHTAWSVAKYGRDVAEGRFYNEARRVYMSFPAYAGVAYRDERGPRDIHALDYPYEGVVLEVVDPTGDRGALKQWLHQEYLPARLTGSPIAMTLLFEPNPMRDSEDQQEGSGIERLVTMLSFSEAEPADCWATVFAGAGAAVASSGLGDVVLAAPFCPTLPGTDTYVDQLR